VLLAALGIWLAVAWPYDWSLSALQSLPDRTAGLGAPLIQDVRDVVVNLLVFAPLGCAAETVATRPLLRTGLLAVVLSTVLESSQIFQFSRIISPLDVLVNGLGAVGGALSLRLGLASLKRVRHAAVHPGLLLIGGMTIAAGLFAWLQQRFGAVDSWSLEYRLQLGNEATGDRLWCGEVGGLVLTAGGRTWTESAFTWMPRHAEGGDPCTTWRQTAVPPVDLVEAIRRSGRVRVELWARPSRLDQHGPARIVSISRDPDTRNLTVGQDGPDLVVRVRRWWSGSNGVRPYYRLANVFQADKPVRIVVEAGSDSTEVRAGEHALVHQHRVERQWWLLLVAGYEWRSSNWELPLALAFWTLLLGPCGALTGGAFAGRGGGTGLTVLLCAMTGAVGWLALRVTHVPVGLESLALMPLALTLPAELARRLMRRPSPTSGAA